AASAGAGDCSRYFAGTLLPQLRELPGFAGAYLLRRDLGEDGTAELTAHTFWESPEAIRDFGGDDITVAIVEAKAQALLLDFDRTAAHRSVVVDDRGRPARRHLNITAAARSPAGRSGASSAVSVRRGIPWPVNAHGAPGGPTREYATIRPGGCLRRRSKMPARMPTASAGQRHFPLRFAQGGVEGGRPFPQIVYGEWSGDPVTDAGDRLAAGGGEVDSAVIIDFLDAVPAGHAVVECDRVLLCESGWQVEGDRAVRDHYRIPAGQSAGSRSRPAQGR